MILHRMHDAFFKATNWVRAWLPIIHSKTFNNKLPSIDNPRNWIVMWQSTVTLAVELGSLLPIASDHLSTAMVVDGTYPLHVVVDWQWPLSDRFAMERSSTNIKVFFWPRNSGSVPNEVRNGAGSVNPDNWVRYTCWNAHGCLDWCDALKGTPIANFPNSQCNLDSHFSAHNIIINLTFCKSSFILPSSLSHLGHS